MTRIRRILVPIDFSRSSVAAIRAAKCIARASNSEIHLLHAARSEAPLCWSADLLAGRSEALHALNRLAALMVAEGLEPGRTVGLVRNGPADEVIARYEGEIHPDLVVLGLDGDRLPPASVGPVRIATTACDIAGR